MLTKVEKARREALEEEGTKYCSKCQAVKPLEDFTPARNKNTRKGVCAQCRMCRNEYHRIWQELKKPAQNKFKDRATKKEMARREALETTNSKFCSRCHRVKHLSDFFNEKTGRKGVRNQCKSCRAVAHRKRAHAITTNEYRKLLEAQGGKCAICGKIALEGEILCVDHDHSISSKRDAIRGLLCHRCNMALGGFKDNFKVLQTAITYLSIAREKTQIILNNT